MESSRTFTLVCAWRLIPFFAQCREKRSIRFSQYAEVGVKCT